MKKHNLILYAVHFLLISFLFYVLQIFYFLIFKKHSYSICLSSYLIFLISFFLICLDIVINRKHSNPKKLIFSPIKNPKIAVILTAYNDELSIGNAVKDFINREFVSKVIVIDNNSIDNTEKEAKNAGATVIKETIRGYGAVCIRGLKEALKYGDLICLAEGDGTFSGNDLKKFMAYIENADMVIGTRTTRELNSPDSQINFALEWGNILMAKLLQVKFWSVRLTDMGCTYRLIRKEALEKIIEELTVTDNHFLCEMVLAALKKNLMVIEIPITFRKRIGESKGVGNNFWKAAKTAFDMWKLILTK